MIIWLISSVRNEKLLLDYHTHTTKRICPARLSVGHCHQVVPTFVVVDDWPLYLHSPDFNCTISNSGAGCHGKKMFSRMLPASLTKDSDTLC